MTNKKIYPLIAVTILVIGFSINYSYAIEEGGINEQTHKLVGSSTKAIPDWVKTNFDWYLKGNIDEATLLTSMNWMFDNNIMHLSEKAAQEVKELRAENQKLHEQLGHELTHTQQQGSGETPQSTEPDKFGKVKVQFPWDRTSSCILDISNEPGKELVILALDPTNLDDSEKQEIGKRNYCVQYNESDLDFVSRLMERDGVSYYFKDDSSTKAQITTPQILIPSRTAGEMATKELIQQYENAEAKTVDITNKIKANIEEKTNLKERIANIRSQIDTTYDRATKVTLEKEIALLEAKIATLDDMTQMMQLDLQDAMNKQSQVFTMLSNVMKSFHDTAKSIINNIK